MVLLGIIRIAIPQYPSEKINFFLNSDLSLQQIIIFMYGWARDFPQNDIAYEAGITPTSYHTLVVWCNFYRKNCEQNLIDHSMVTGGLNASGSPKMMKIDDCNFFHKKYRGQWRDGHWVFEGIERSSRKCFLVEVSDRTAETLSA